MVSNEDKTCDGLFDCALCGDCCKGYGGTYVTESDIEAIACYINVSVEELITRYTQKSGSKRLIVQGENGYCIFLDKVCTIHPVKPEMCRRWPFIRSVLADVKNWRAMAASCPGMNPDAPDQKIVDCIKKSLEE